eukprot:gene11156-gene3465
MFGCRRAFKSEISRSAVHGTPSSSDSSRIVLSATCSPDSMISALYTTPYVPSPSLSDFLY